MIARGAVGAANRRLPLACLPFSPWCGYGSRHSRKAKANWDGGSACMRKSPSDCTSRCGKKRRTGDFRWLAGSLRQWRGYGSRRSRKAKANRDGGSACMRKSPLFGRGAAGKSGEQETSAGLQARCVMARIWLKAQPQGQSESGRRERVHEDFPSDCTWRCGKKRRTGDFRWLAGSLRHGADMARGAAARPKRAH